MLTIVAKSFQVVFVTCQITPSLRNHFHGHGWMDGCLHEMQINDCMHILHAGLTLKIVIGSPYFHFSHRFIGNIMSLFHFINMCVLDIIIKNWRHGRGNRRVYLQLVSAAQ